MVSYIVSLVSYILSPPVASFLVILLSHSFLVTLLYYSVLVSLVPQLVYNLLVSLPYRAGIEPYRAGADEGYNGIELYSFT